MLLLLQLHLLLLLLQLELHFLLLLFELRFGLLHLFHGLPSVRVVTRTGGGTDRRSWLRAGLIGKPAGSAVPLVYCVVDFAVRGELSALVAGSPAAGARDR